MLNFNKYKLPYSDEPTYPKRPKICNETDESKINTYISDLKKYNEQKKIWDEYINQRNIQKGELENQFKIDLFEDFGITNNPKAELLYSKAWELGHASGLHEVYSYASDLVDLIL